jgi:hypothetical protein
MQCKRISKSDLKVGDKTVLGEVKDIEWSKSRKTVKITVTTHSGAEFTDSTSAAAGIMVFDNYEA